MSRTVPELTFSLSLPESTPLPRRIQMGPATRTRASTSKFVPARADEPIDGPAASTSCGEGFRKGDGTDSVTAAGRADSGMGSPRVHPSVRSERSTTAAMALATAPQSLGDAGICRTARR